MLLEYTNLQILLLSYQSLSEPVYIIEIFQKGRASEMMSDTYGHKILAGEFYFCGNYLRLVRSRNISLQQFELINFDVLILPEEVFESYVEVNRDLIMSRSM